MSKNCASIIFRIFALSRNLAMLININFLDLHTQFNWNYGVLLWKAKDFGCQHAAQ